MKKRILSLLLVLCLAVALVPMAVLAADGDGKAIRSGIGDIVGYNSTSRTYNYIYYGTWRDSPIKWRVLDTKTNTGETGALFLMTDECLYPLPGDLYACYIQFNPANKPNRHLWKDSTLQDWFKNTFYSGENSAFTSAERALIPATTQASSVYSYKAPNAPSYFPPMRFQICALEAEHVFAPSIQDIMNADYGFIDSTSRIAGPIDSSGRGTRYWLRSFEISEQLPFCVGHDASLNGDYGDNPSAVRPAMNLSTAGNNILFVSKAEGGKPAGGLAEIPEYTGNEWKLTLKDSSRSGFSVTTAEVSTSTKGGTVEISYSDAKTGANEYISVLLKDSSGNPAYYGRSNASLTEKDGTAQLTIPAGFAEGTYTMKVFNEQYNGECKTDLASGFADVTLTVEKRVEEQFTLTPGGRYYFDLSAMNIPGTANSNLPDSTLHYVPFTYVGTVNAYSLKNEADNDTTSYEHSLFIANYNVTHTVSWNDLNTAGLLFGKDYAGGGVNYTLRAPSAGFHYSYDQNVGGTPRNNEWDVILDKAKQGNNDNTNGYVKNWQDIYSLGQDKSSAIPSSNRSLRGYKSSRYWYTESATRADANVGFRPVLELPTDLAADSLKVVELVTAGHMPGETYNSINIIVKKGESFTAPSAEGLPLSDGISADTPMWWVDENLNFYKPGDTVPADVSALSAFYGAFGLFLDRGDGEVEVTPDNYTDIFDDGTASFVLPKGRSLTELGESVNLTSKDILEIYSTGRLERYGCVFPNLKLKNADLTSVRLSKKFIGRENPLFITLDGKNTVGSLNRISMSRNTLSVLGDGSLTLNSALTLSQYTQYGGGSVTMTDGLTAYDLSIDSGSLTVTGDPQAITLRDQDISNLYMGDGVRLFTGSSAQDAAEADVPQLSAKMQEVYKRYQAEDNTLTYEELSALNNALREQFNAIFRQLSGKTYVRITGAWDVTYQPGENGDGNAVTDIKFYNDILTLRSKLFTRTGYTQTGWATVDGGEKVYAFGGIYTTNAALTLYPVWQMDTYAITYDLNGGTAEGNPDTYTVETDAFTLKNPTRPGYTFTGWSGTGLTGEDNLTVTIQKGSTGNRSYTAHWRYNGGGSSGYSYYTIKATAGTGGSISPSGNVSVREGRNQTFTITPDKGYAVANVKIDGKSIGAVKSYTFENVRRTHTIEVIFMKANGNPQTGVFVDVATGSYYEDAVDWAVENGITTGVSANRFDPNGVCTRAQAVTFLWRAAGSPAPRSRTMPFTDVPVGSYYYDAVLWAVENSITKGTSDTTFSPNMTCSRAQIVAFLWRSEKSPAAGTANPFADVKSTAYYADAVLWAVKENITKGTTNTTFSPDADCTRAQIVTFLWRCKK